MQLIQLSEPAAVDIKKTMSKLENTLETSQINGALDDIEQDCAMHNILLNKKDTISKSDEEITISCDQITNIQNKIKDLNGITKTNGDTKNNDEQSNEEETEVCKDNIENGSPVNSKSNGNSTLIEACSPTSMLDIANTENKNNISVEKKNDDLELEDDAQEMEDVTTGNLEITDDSSNSKLITDDVSIDKNEKASGTDKLDDIKIPEEIQDVSTFSPHSDTNENKSEQLLQLEDNDSMEDTRNTHENNKTISPIMVKVDEMQESATDQRENTGINKIEELEEKDIVDSRNMQTNEDSQLATEMQPLDAINDKLENCIEPSLDHSTEKETENEEDCLVAIDKQLLEDDENDSSCDIIMNNINPVSTEDTLDSNNKTVDETPTYQKCIKIRNFSDMVEKVVSDNEAVESKEVESKEVLADLKETQLKEKHQTQDEVMDVDMSDDISLVTPEKKYVLKDVPDQLPLIQGSEIENNDVIVEKDNTKDTPEGNKSEISEEKEKTITEKTDNDDVVMEVDDDIVVSDIDKTIPETTIVSTESQNASETKEPSEQDAVINIVDKEGEGSNNSQIANSEINNDKTSEVVSIDESVNDCNIKESKELPSEASKDVEVDKISENSQVLEKKIEKPLPIVCKLSNTMDILSDEEDEPLSKKPCEEEQKQNEEQEKGELDKKAFNIDDDDDIMFIEDSNSQDANVKPTDKNVETETQTVKTTSEIQPETGVEEEKITTNTDDLPKSTEKCDITPIETASQPKEEETKVGPSEEIEAITPIITKTFLKTVTKNLADMTRNELEDFCILKLVESVVDKSSLNEIKSKVKTMAQTIEELRKKTLALTKQNRDLQVVVKTVQEDQKKRNSNPMMPMKITRSVGMQVVLNSADKSILKKKLTTPLPPPTIPARPVRNVQSPKTQKPAANNIPVPRLVPASSPTNKPAATPPSATKPVPNARNTTPQRAEKRQLSKSSPGSSVTVDLTDDEPPAKVNVKNPTPPVRLVPSQNLMPAKTRPQFGPTSNSPRKVYIPISSNNPNIRPPPAVIKNFVPSQRPRQPGVVRMQTIRMNQVPSCNRHPAPLPDAMKQYQPPTWKALPPAPDLKLSKVDNGIVISWKFEGYQPDSYEEVASFQLYAYQETPAPPSTALWKKIGDIKALPLPMACTLTQFMSGFKYYFAVRAIDVRSRIGPFSLPGSIMLISKS